MASKELYYWYKDHGICVSCGSQDAAFGRIYCLTCSDKHQESTRKYKKKHPVTLEQKTFNNERQKKTRKERKAAGLCTICGKRAVSNGRSQCDICRNKNNLYRRNKHIINGGISSDLRGNGVYCYLCCKPVCKDEYYCPSCRQKVVNNAKIARSHINREKHIWKTF